MGLNVSERSITRWLVPGGIAVVVIALGAIALLRDPLQLDPDTPEGTVQEYLLAISDEDFERAFKVLHPESFEGCDSADIARSRPREPFSATIDPDGEFGGFDGGFREEPPGFAPVDPDATVSVILRFGGSGPFDAGWENYEVFFLVEEDGFWWITGDPWPYFSWNCRQGDF